jgi:hypothetical protein
MADLDELFKSDDPIRRVAAVSSPSADESLLLAALADTHHAVRIAAVSNPSATERVIEVASQSLDINVRTAAARHPSMEDVVRRRARLATNDADLVELLGSPFCPADIVHQSATSPNMALRMATAQSPAATPNVLIALLDDSDPRVAVEAMQSPLTPADRLQCVAIDDGRPIALRIKAVAALTSRGIHSEWKPTRRDQRRHRWALRRLGV